MKKADEIRLFFSGRVTQLCNADELSAWTAVCRITKEKNTSGKDRSFLARITPAGIS